MQPIGVAGEMGDHVSDGPVRQPGRRREGVVTAAGHGGVDGRLEASGGVPQDLDAGRDVRWHSSSHADILPLSGSRRVGGGGITWTTAGRSGLLVAVTFTVLTDLLLAATLLAGLNAGLLFGFACAVMP